MPTKKPRGEELTWEQQLANQALNQRRLRIAHGLCRVHQGVAYRWSIIFSNGKTSGRHS